VHWFALVGKEGVSAEELEQKALTLLKTRHKIDPTDRRGIGSFNLQEEFDKVQGLFTGIRMLMWIVGLGTLAAGAIGVSNILLIVVRERTKELGIRRAVGATPWKVRGQILIEAVLLTSASGLAGLMLGVFLLEVVAKLVPTTGADGSASMFQAPGIDLPSAAFAVGVLVVAGAIAGFLPAQRAVSVSPVEALRAD
jgi:putative ABC transport system permease protein